ncbi:MAG: PD40 domain-containing protein [Planctomycetes bacterium]|nr:PD40 domain-containing protein [Planctomycetota bacterium]
MSADGRFVAFLSVASNLVPGDANGTYDVFVHDQMTGATTRVSVDSADGEANSGSDFPSISADGRFVAFNCQATNLVPGDTNGMEDVFVHDQMTGATTRVSVDSAGVEGNAHSFLPSISADGRFVAFNSQATNLVPGDANATDDIFVHDRATGATVRVSVDSAGGEGNGGTYYSSSVNPSISADGRFVAFQSSASNLVPDDTNDVRDIFVHDRETGVTTRVSVDSAGMQANMESPTTSISADGRFVAFASYASNLVPGDTNATKDIFVHDRMTAVTTRESVDSGGVQATWDCGKESISADGRFVAFLSRSPLLVPGDTNLSAGINDASDAFVHDRATGATTRVSVNSQGGQANHGGSYAPFISADGRFVAFSSYAETLVPGDTNLTSDIFVHEFRDQGACRAGSVNAGGGLITDVLFLNGSSGDQNRIVTVPVSAPIQVSLNAAPNGPGGPGMPVARYAVWVWAQYASNAFDLTARGELLGCTVNPTPFRPLAAPQPFRCLHGTGLPGAVCGPVPTLPSPARAPWTFTRAAGISRPAAFTFQGVLEDAGAANASGFSVTNAVILRIE